MAQLDDLYNALRAADAAGDTAGAQRLGQYIQSLPSDSAPLKIGASGFTDALKDVVNSSSWVDRNLAGAGTALGNLWQGTKQIFGQGDDQAIQANRTIASQAPVGAFAGNVGLGGLTAFVPGANTLVGAGIVGALTGGLQPTQGDESRLLNTGVGGAVGVGSQYLGNKLGGYIADKVSAAKAAAAIAQAQNATRDATLSAGQAAGYQVPPSAVNPTLFNNIVESIGGKAAIGQQASGTNAAVTNALARKTLGLPEDTALNEDVLNQFRQAAAQPYRDVAALPAMPPQRTTGIGGYPLIGPPQQPPAAALAALQQARFDAAAAWKEYNRSGEVAARDAATALSNKVNGLESYLENTAQAAGQPDLVAALRTARQKIAQSYSIQNAMNDSTGDVSARALAQAMNKGAPLTGDLKVAADFANAFPKYTQPATAAQGAGVHGVSPWLAILGAKEGYEYLGVPGAIAGAALPYSRGAARALVLSDFGQKMATPSYSPGMVAKVLSGVTPANTAAMLKALTTAGALSAASSTQ